MTLVGAVLIPLALYWLARRPALLYMALIVSLPFSATAIVNFGGKGIPAWMYLGTLWMGRELYPELGRMSFRYPQNLRGVRTALLIFCAIAAFSLIMPVILSGKIVIDSPILFRAESEPLHLSAKNFTSLLYLWFGALLALLVARRNSNREAFIATMKIYLSSVFFEVLWGIFQWVLLKGGLPYPGFIFNNSETRTAQGFASFLSEGVPRISSVAVEPSILSQVLLTALPFVIFTGVLRFPVLSRRRNFWLGTLIAIVLVLSTSFAAYIGSAIVMLTVVSAFTIAGILRFRHLLFAVALLFSILAVYLVVPAVSEFVNSQLLTKSESYSGLERIRTVLLAYDYFQESPVLGLGWGSVTSHDLVMNLLSNVGGIGLISFSAYVIVLSRRLRVSIRNSFYAEEKCLKIAITLSLITLLLMNVFTGFTFVFGHLWFTFALAMAASAMKYERPIEAVAASSGSNNEL